MRCPLCGHAHDAVVAIDLLVQKRLQVGLERLHLRRSAPPAAAAALRTSVDTADAAARRFVPRRLQQIDHLPVDQLRTTVG